MNDPATNGVHLTKEYYKDFLPTDLQWSVTKVDNDFTLYDLFRLVEHAQHMIPNIFATMGMLEFQTFWEQIQLDHKLDDDDEVQYLELYWSTDYEVKTTKKTGKHTDQNKSSIPIDQTQNYWDEPKMAELSNLMGFHGIGNGCPSKNIDFHECGDDCPKITAYAIEFTPLNNLAHLSIRVSPNVEFYPPYVESDREFHKTGFELKINPTLWCFITSIFWELTFAGSTPNDVSIHRDKIMDSFEKVKEQMKENDNKNEDCSLID